MKKFLIVVGFILFSLWQSVAAQSSPEGNWTGGFWLEGNWVAVNVRFDRQSENPGGTADIIFPFYGGSENAINVALESLKQTSVGAHFEIPVRTGRVIFDGLQKSNTISGSYVFNRANGTFGLTRVANVTLEALEKYYGAYRVSPDRVSFKIRQ